MIMQTMKEIFEEIETNGGMTPSRRLRAVSYTHLTLPTT